MTYERNKKRKLQLEVAEETGIQNTIISKAENGWSVSRDTVETLCAYYGIDPVEVILPDVPDEQRQGDRNGDAA